MAKLHMIKATIPRERAFKDAEEVKAILKFTRVDIHTIRGKAGKDNTLSTLKEILGETKKSGTHEAKVVIRWLPKLKRAAVHVKGPVV